MNLSKRRLEKLSDIAADVGLVCLASIVLPAVLDKFNPPQVILGVIITLTCWSASIWLQK